MRKFGNFIFGALIGGVVGSTLALLLPQHHDSAPNGLFQPYQG